METGLFIPEGGLIRTLTDLGITDFRPQELGWQPYTVPLELMPNLVILGCGLQWLRNKLNSSTPQQEPQPGSRSDWGRVKIRVHSGFRTHEHNQAVGGAKGSRHLIGLAADIHAYDARAGLDLEPSHLYTVADDLFKGRAALGLYKGHVHIDFRNWNDSNARRVRWVG